jgi:hypothetical protein
MCSSRQERTLFSEKESGLLGKEVGEREIAAIM